MYLNFNPHNLKSMTTDKTFSYIKVEMVENGGSHFTIKCYNREDFEIKKNMLENYCLKHNIGVKVRDKDEKRRYKH